MKYILVFLAFITSINTLALALPPFAQPKETKCDLNSEIMFVDIKYADEFIRRRGQFETMGDVLCITNSSFENNSNYDYDIAGQKILQQELKLADACFYSLSETKPLTYNGEEIGIITEAFCMFSGKSIPFKIRATKDIYLITSMSQHICGPELNVENSEWDKRIKKKYVNIQMSDPNKNLNEIKKSIEEKFIIGEYVNKLAPRDPSLPINPYIYIGSNGTESIAIEQKKYTEDNYGCKARSLADWRFEISMAPQVIQRFNKKVVETIINEQGLGDDF